MLFVIVDPEEPTQNDAVVVEATTATAALASQDWISDGDLYEVFPIRKSEGVVFTAEQKMVFTPKPKKK